MNNIVNLSEGASCEFGGAFVFYFENNIFVLRKGLLIGRDYGKSFIF